MNPTQNYDQTELNKFAAHAFQWWDPEGELKTLHQINPLRLGYIKEKLDLHGKSVIDVGCGGGILAESLALAGAKVTGIDLNKPLIEVAKLHQYESGTQVEYLVSSAEEMANTRPNQFDVVTCFEMLEHVPDPIAIIEACKNLVKPGGHLFFSTLNRNPKSYLFAILGAEYILKILPKATHDYAKFIRPSELSEWMRQCELIPCELKGLVYSPFSKIFKLSDDISVNYFLYAKKA